MKLATFATAAISRPGLGLIRDDEIVDVDLAARALNLIPPDTMLDLLDHQEQGMYELHEILKKTAGRPFSDVKTFTGIGAVHKLAEVQLFAPIPRPHKNIMCLGWNYAEHEKETAALRGRASAIPEAPVFFTKAPTTVNGPYGNIIIDPAVSEEVDWEVELGVIIGKTGKNIREEDALSYIFGYTVINDVTARDLQSRHKQFFKGKSIDGYCPMGPWIVTADEIADPQSLMLYLRVNGVTKQEASTSSMIFSVRQIIAVLSAGLTLEPGDIKAGDVVEAEVEGIGMLRNAVVGV
jgi:2-keto-4-pentenoate hydratase/2-oxohepta-3-ene-1,7-dioic acid hydratase in catechol pathway